MTNTWDTLSDELVLPLNEARLRDGVAQLYVPGPGAPRRVAAVWLPTQECFEVRTLDTPEHLTSNRVMKRYRCYQFDEAQAAFVEEAGIAIALWAAYVIGPRK